MTPRPLTDAQLAAGLRVYLPEARGGLHERILGEISTTPQERRLPSIFGRLTDADPLARRRMTLLVALVALALSLSAAAIAGALLREKQAPDLSLDRPADLDGFVLASYGKLVDLPAFKLVHSPGEGPIATYYYDGQGRLREEAGEPGQASIFASDFMAHAEGPAGGPTWVVNRGEWGHPLSRLAEIVGMRSPNCVTGWEYVDLAYLLERATHHVRCVSEGDGMGPLENHQWIDIDTGLVLRSGAPAFQQTESGSLEPLGLTFNEITELEFGPQPADLFVVDDEGVTQPTASPNPSATPIITPPPAEAQGEVPADLAAFVALVHAAYESGDPADIRIDAAHHPNLPGVSWTRWQRDGLGNYRLEIDSTPDDGRPGTVFLYTGGHAYETDPRPTGQTWRDWGAHDEGWGAPTMGLPQSCGTGWLHLGFDRVLDRTAHHLSCGFQEYWIDAEWLFVTRGHDHDPMLGSDPGAGLSAVTSVSFGPQPAELFEAPAPDDVWR